MPVINLRFEEKEIRDYPIAIGQNCTIGRKKSNDIVIENLAVSGEHARIESVATNFVLRDLESTNGTFVNKRKVTLHILRHNDTILIGKHELVFDRSDLIKEPGEEPDSHADDDKTKILDTNEFGYVMNKQPGAAPLSSDQSQHKKASFFSRLLKKLFG